MFLSIIFDIIVALILIFCIYCSAKKGFLGSSYKFFSIILTLILMFMFQTTISDWLRSTDVGKYIETTIYDSLIKKSEDTNTSEEITDDKENIFTSLGLPKIYDNLLKDEIDSINNTKDNIVKNVATALTDSLINIVSIIILYILIRFLLFLLYKITNFIFRLPILKSLNKLLGAVVGLIQGLFVVYILCALLIWFSPKNDTNSIQTTINDTIITQYFYNNNLLINFFIK